jgi:glycosyltransferase involved in cell wall biosynthesis
MRPRDQSRRKPVPERRSPKLLDYPDKPISHDFLLFPSLHDSGGFVVLEALCHGMPVLCLDLGGPKEIVSLDSGLIIKTDAQCNSGRIKHCQ